MMIILHACMFIHQQSIGMQVADRIDPSRTDRDKTFLDACGGMIYMYAADHQ